MQRTGNRKTLDIIKKLLEKSLIPLPPAGFVSVFCANARRVKPGSCTNNAAGAGRFRNASLLERLFSFLRRNTEARHLRRDSHQTR